MPHPKQLMCCRHSKTSRSLQVPYCSSFEGRLISWQTYVLAVFFETLRLYPSVVVIPKYAMQDTLVPCIRRTGDEPPTREQVLIPAGGEVFLNSVALHYNRECEGHCMTFTNAQAAVHWGADADEFRPERFIDTDTYQWPRDAFLAFSSGPRSCLGQKFAQVEAVNVLTNIVRRYEVVLQEDVDGTAPLGETRRQKRDRITACKTVITLTPSKVPMVFRERP
jgi:cytochrome P450